MQELQRQLLRAFTPPPGRKALCGKGFECLTNKKLGFTLAEILISLLILGVIASLTIPSLIQNTHKKEEVVKVKKGLSVINQAISMDKALTGEDLSQYEVVGNTSATDEKIINMFKKRLSITDTYAYDYFLTQDGLGFRFTYYGDSGDNVFHGYIVTKPSKSAAEVYNYQESIMEYEGTTSTVGHLNGLYDFICSYDRCVPSENTAAIINAADPTKAE